MRTRLSVRRKFETQDDCTGLGWIVEENRSFSNLAESARLHTRMVRNFGAFGRPHEFFKKIQESSSWLFAASKTWRRLKGTKPKVIAGVRFNDGIEVIHVPANNAA